MNVRYRKVVARLVALLATFAVMTTGSLVTAGAASADASTTISGTITAQGAPVSGVWINGGTVDAEGYYDSDDYTWAPVDASGRFSVDVVADQGATYPAYWIDGGSLRTQVNGVWYGAWAKIPVSLGSTVNAVFVSRPNTDQTLNLAVAGVPADTGVGLYMWEDGTGWYWVSSDRTDAAGIVEFSAYKGARYTLRISETDTSYAQYLGGSQQAPESGTAPGTFTTGTDATYSNWFSAVPAASASGQVSWAAVFPTDATATLIRWVDNGDGSGYWANEDTVKVKADATFQFGGLVPGETYSAFITSENKDGVQTHVRTWLGGTTIEPTEKAQVTSAVAAAGGTLAFGVIPVTTVAGRINVELNGFPAGQQIDIRAYDIARGYSRSATAKLNAAFGTKAIEGLEPGTYWVYASTHHQGQSRYYAEQFGSVVVVSGATTPVVLTAASALTHYETRLVAKIDGQRRVGETLTARPLLTKAPTAFASGVKYSYVWRDGKKVLGTGATLKLTAAMMDKTANISVFVLAAAPGYVSDWAITGINSDYTEVDPGLRPVPTKVPSISGKVGFGKKLTANPGTWSPAPTKFTYQWLRNGAVIKGATAKTYKPRRADAGKRISVRVTPVLEGHDSLAVTSLRTTALPKVAGKVTAKLAKKAIKAKSRAKVTVTVKSKGISPITGKVTVKAGKKSKTVTLKASKKGKVTVTLPKLKKGTYKLKVTYKGNSQVKKSTMKKTLTLKVK